MKKQMDDECIEVAIPHELLHAVGISAFEAVDINIVAGAVILCKPLLTEVFPP